MAQVWSWVGRAILRRGKVVAAGLALATVVLAAGATRLEFETHRSGVPRLGLTLLGGFFVLAASPMLPLFDVGVVIALVRLAHLSEGAPT